MADAIDPWNDPVEHAEWVRDAVAAIENEWGATDDPNDTIQVLRRLAAKLAALLPPAP